MALIAVIIRTRLNVMVIMRVHISPYPNKSQKVIFICRTN